MRRRQIGFVPTWMFDIAGACLILIGNFSNVSAEAHLAEICFGVILIGLGLVKNWLEWRNGSQ